MAKRLIRLFGFHVHDAPGEGEAECAFLQQQGVVDAVLSEDVDTIMFGCTRTLRDWSGEGRTAKTPTHVSMYDVRDMALGDLGLDREGMVLVALMSGGDYLPDGIPGCGVKVACEAAKAGFGKSLCQLKASDEIAIKAWRNSLIHELKTNEKGYFRTKHKSLTIPQDFPNIEVLRYYTHPVVSPETDIESIRQRVQAKQEFHLTALREFTRETFDWDYRIGAIKFIRVLGQAMLVQNMASSSETQHVKRISGRRTHFSTDGTPELRLAYVPEEVVPIDLSQEVEENISFARTGLALNSDEELDAIDVVEEGSTAGAPKIFDVGKPDLAWVLEGLVKKAAPDVFREWQTKEQAKAIRRSPKKKPGVAKASKSSDMPRGSLDKYVKATKSAALVDRQESRKGANQSASLLKSPSRPGVSPSPSKQSSSSPTRSPKKTAIIHAIDSSPFTPRSCRPQKQPDPIYISSSPPAPASSPRRPSASGSSSNKAPVSAEANRVPDSVRSIIQASRGSLGVKPSSQRQRERPSRETKMGDALLKQSSMEMFLSKPKTNAAEPREVQKEKEVETEDSDSDLASVSSLIRPSLPTERDSMEKKASRTGVKSSQINSSSKKKIFRARKSESGFFEEVELEAEERELEANSKTGKKAAELRWSDVSVIDLTAADNQC